MTTTYDWQGAVGDVWAREWRLTDRSFADLTPRLNAAALAAAPAGQFTAVDIGCGAGETSLALARSRPDGQVIGIDLSASLVAIAQERSEEVNNVRFVEGDAGVAAAAIAPVDLFLSRHGVMFFDDPIASFAALRATASAGAAIVFSCFDSIEQNEWATILSEAAPAQGYVPGPFGFADPDYVSEMLAAAGWREASPTLVPFRYIAGVGADPISDALAFFGRIGPNASALRQADPAMRADLLLRLERAAVAARHGDTVAFPASAWLWSAKA